jgi:hypothetical protein
MVDLSSSVGKKYTPYLLQFINALINALPVGQNKVRIGLFRYDKHSTLVFPLNKYYTKKALIAAVNNIRYHRSGTYTHRVLRHVRKRYVI